MSPLEIQSWIKQSMETEISLMREILENLSQEELALQQKTHNQLKMIREIRNSLFLSLQSYQDRRAVVTNNWDLDIENILEISLLAEKIETLRARIKMQEAGNASCKPQVLPSSPKGAVMTMQEPKI